MGNPLAEIFFEKSLKMPKKNQKGGPIWNFSTSLLSQIIKKLKQDTLVKTISKTNPTMPKNLKGGPFSLARYCILRGKRRKTFWFSSPGQIIHFGTIKFRRTFKNYFGQFVWIEKRVTIKVVFYFMKHRLKMPNFFMNGSF